jgi:Fic family protein
MRRYEKSHPWLTFDVSTALRHAPPKLWMALGEVQSKCEHIAGIPLPPLFAAKLHQIYLAKGAWATTAIEGNTLSEAEVRRIIAGDRRRVPPSKEYLAQEITNIVEACNNLLQSIQGDIALLTVENIKTYNLLILRELEVEDHIIPGEFCLKNIGVADYLAPPREDSEYLVRRLCNWLNHETFRPTGDEAIIYGVLRAVLAHLYIAWIHPFGDGNGRTARLVEYQIMLAAGMPTPAAHLLSNHYNQTRSEYYRQLAQASATSDPLPFILYATQGLVDGLREQIGMIRDMQRQVMWINYVHTTFHGKASKTDIRRRDLILDMSDAPKPITLTEIPEMSARMARHYASLSLQTVRRDVDELISIGFVVKLPDGYVSNTDIMKAFLPGRRDLATE